MAPHIQGGAIRFCSYAEKASRAVLRGGIPALDWGTTKWYPSSMSTAPYFTFVHTPEFDESLEDIPMSDDELAALQADLVRVAAKGRGKRGGARGIYFFVSKSMTVYLLLAYSKSEKDDLTPAEVKILKSIVSQLK